MVDQIKLKEPEPIFQRTKAHFVDNTNYYGKYKLIHGSVV